jgi:hypothetical protein
MFYKSSSFVSLVRSLKPRNAARCEGECSAKLFLSEETGMVVSTEMMDGAAWLVQWLKKLSWVGPKVCQRKHCL